MGGPAHEKKKCYNANNPSGASLAEEIANRTLTPLKTSMVFKIQDCQTMNQAPAAATNTAATTSDVEIEVWSDNQPSANGPRRNPTSPADR